MSVLFYCPYVLKRMITCSIKIISVPPFSFLWGGGYEGSLLFAVLRTSIPASGMSDTTVSQRRNMCHCQLELGVVGRWKNRLPLIVGGTTVPVLGVRLIPYWPKEEHV
jgi:hypothetical protein